MNIENYIIDIGLQIVVLIIGIATFKSLPDYFKLLLLQVLFSLLNYFIGKFLNYTYGTNYPAYNIYMALEAGCLLVAAFVFLKIDRFKKIIRIGGGMVLAGFVVHLLLAGFWEFGNYYYCFISMIITGVYLFVLYNQITEDRNTSFFDPMIITSLGIVIYFACLAPYMALFHYLRVNNPELFNILFNLILLLLCNVRYLFLAIGVLLLSRQRDKNKHQFIS